MHSIPTRILLLLLFFSSLVAAADFADCLSSLRATPTATGGVNFQGQPTSAASAVGLTYSACTERCGSDSERFRWSDFAQLFSSWLLPWLALVSQLPFGSGNYIDDSMSVAMSVGSPALAAYSLVLTAQNARLVYRRAQRIEDGSKDTVARALISLQQVPLELTKDKRLLAFIPINDQWRQEIVERLNRRNAWSLATGSSVAWVIIAFIFTLIDSFVSLDDPNGSSQGHSVGTLWLSLLCLVIGWLWVPTFTCGELKSAISFANRKAARKAAKGIKRGAHKVVNFTKAKFTGLPRRVRGFKKAETDPTPEIPEENEKVKDDSDQEDTEPAKQTGLKPNPVSNPAHQHSTVSFQLPAESQQGHGHLTVSGNPTANQSVVSVARSTAQQSVAQSSLKSGRDRLLISKDRSDSLNHDEFRLAATFNYSRVMGYLTLVDDVVNALNKLAHRKDEKRPISEDPTVQPIVVFPPGVFSSMFKATILALVLQCGTAAAATIIVVFTPRVGLGCRSLGYIIYAGVSVLILFLTIFATIFARISETRGEKSTIVRGFTGFIARALHYICLLLGAINAAGLIVISCFQFSHFLDNCYCNASVLGNGVGSYMIIEYESDNTSRNSRIAAVGLSAGSMLIYMVFLWLLAALPGNVDDL